MKNISFILNSFALDKLNKTTFEKKLKEILRIKLIEVKYKNGFIVFKNHI